MHDVVTVWRRALVAEVCWTDEGDRPEAAAVVPLLLDGVPCVAFPYGRSAVATALARAREVAFAVTDARSLARGEPGVVAFGAVSTVEDLDGSVFVEHLLGQELAKYPPSRTLADSLLLRRENWWWLPRRIVRLDSLVRTCRPAARTEPGGHGVLVHDGTGLRVDTVAVEPGDDSGVRLERLSGEPVRGDTAPALVLGHDYAVADLERWESWSLRGQLVGEQLRVGQREGEPGAALPPLRLRERLRRQREWERACRRQIEAAERARER